MKLIYFEEQTVFSMRNYLINHLDMVVTAKWPPNLEY